MKLSPLKKFYVPLFLTFLLLGLYVGLSNLKYNEKYISDRKNNATSLDKNVNNSFVIDKTLFDLQVKVEFFENSDPYNIFHEKPFNTLVEESAIHPLKHLTTVYDNYLKKYVLKISIHRDYDGDSAFEGLADRQRIEVKASIASDAKILGFEGDTMMYVWWFKVGKKNKASVNFYHIFQLKAIGDNDKMPMFTLSLKKKHDIDYLILTHHGKEKIVTPLSNVKGKWFQACVEVMLDIIKGYIKFNLLDKTGRRLPPNMKQNKKFYIKEITWRNGYKLLRPKWGIYRSLKSIRYLSKEDNLYLTDLTIKKKRVGI